MNTLMNMFNPNKDPRSIGSYALIMALIAVIFLLIGCEGNQEIVIEKEELPTPYYRIYQEDYDGNSELFDVIRSGRTSSDWWTGIGGWLETYCTANPGDCAGDLDALCAANPTECLTSVCTEYPTIPYCVSTPIELLWIDATKMEDYILIEFETVQEINSSHVEIQGSIDPKEKWYSVAIIESECEQGCKYEFEDYLKWLD